MGRNCEEPETFVPQMPFCNLEYNRFEDRDRGTQFSLWGTCTIDNVKTCVWSPEDCPGEYQIPHELNYYSDALDPADKSGRDDICTCDNTKVGACVKNGKYTCAVSADSCGDGSDFKTWQETGSEIDCRLCSPFEH